MKNILLVLFSAFLLFGCGKDSDADTFEEQLALDLISIDDYLAENNITHQIHSSKIRYVLSEKQEGKSPSIKNEVAVRYQSFLLTGEKVAEDTIGLTVSVANSIQAWRHMILEMKEGDVLTMYAPSVYCFGATGRRNVPPNTNLIFEIELLYVIENADEQFSAELAIIDEYLDESEIDHEVNESGIRYVVSKTGTGNSPATNKTVSVRYKGTFLNGVVFDSNETGATFTLDDLIEAWQIMIPTMKLGGKITIYAPSRYCYEAKGNSIIPPNTTLVFEIELLQIDEIKI